MRSRSLAMDGLFILSSCLQLSVSVDLQEYQREKDDVVLFLLWNVLETVVPMSRVQLDSTVELI